MDLKIEDKQQIRMLNGRCVMAALTTFNNKATKEQLCTHFMSRTRHASQLIEKELNIILENGVSEGFIIKSGNNYLLPSQWNSYQVDIKPQTTCANASLAKAYEELKGLSNGQRYFHEVLMSYIIMEASDGVKKNRNSVLNHFTDKLSKSIITNCYNNACDLVESMRYRCRYRLRELVSEKWKPDESSESLQRKYCKSKIRLMDDMNEIRKLDGSICCRTVLDFTISKVKAVVAKEEPKRKLPNHYNEEFNDRLNKFSELIDEMYRSETHFKFDEIYGPKKPVEIEKEIIHSDASANYTEKYGLYKIAIDQVRKAGKDIHEILLNIIIDDAVLKDFTEREERLLKFFNDQVLRTKIFELHNYANRFYEDICHQNILELISTTCKVKDIDEIENTTDWKSYIEPILDFDNRKVCQEFERCVNHLIYLRVENDEGEGTGDIPLDHHDPYIKKIVKDYVEAAIDFFLFRKRFVFEFETLKKPRAPPVIIPLPVHRLGNFHTAAAEIEHPVGYRLTKRKLNTIYKQPKKLRTT